MSKTNTYKRIFEIIKYVTDNDSSSLSDIQKALDIPKSSLHGIMQELCDMNILYYRPTLKAYYLGTEFIQLSAKCLSKADLAGEIKFVATNTSQKVNCSISAGILEGMNVIYLLQSVGSGINSFVKNVGLSIPAHSCSLGKVLLSSYSDEEILKIYENNTGFEKYTDLTIKSVDELLAAVAETREKGYATDIGEFSPYLACVGCPIYINGDIVAAISACVSITMLTDEFMEVVLKSLREAASEIAKRLGSVQ